MALVNRTPKPELLTSREVAAMFRCTLKAVSGNCGAFKDLPYRQVRPGCQKTYRREDVEKLVRVVNPGDVED